MALYTDASGMRGWSIYWSNVDGYWPNGNNIMWKEPYAIACAKHTWSCLWSCWKVLFHCDNLTVVDKWRKGSTSAIDIMAPIGLLYFCAAQHNIHVIVTHKASIHNSVADALSRFQVSCFQQLVLQALSQPDSIPAWPTHFLKNSSINASNLK